MPTVSNFDRQLPSYNILGPGFRKVNIVTHELIREFQTFYTLISYFETIVHKMPSLTCINDKQGIHIVPGRAPAPRRVLKVVVVVVV